MMSEVRSRSLSWTTIVPFVGLLVLALGWGRHLGSVVAVVVALVLAAAVLASVHHAEVVAHRVGEPFGSLLLAVSVTVIEVALIVTLMVSGGPETHTLARDTVFAAVMITCNGILGISLLIGSIRNKVAVFSAEGTGAALAAVATLATVTLVLPTFTTSQPGRQFSPTQLTFAAVASLIVYWMFVLTQTVRHRDFFLPVDDEGSVIDEDNVVDGGSHAKPPTTRVALISLGLLLLALVDVVGLAKLESPTLESAVDDLDLPQSFVGVIIALLVLLPETLSAVNAARRDRVQTSLNLALGSAVASIGLTIPAVAVASIWIDGRLVLGLGPTQMVLLLISVVVGILTVAPGRTTRLQAELHLVLLASFLFLAAFP